MAYFPKAKRWLVDTLPPNPGRHGRDVRVTDLTGLFRPFWVSSEREAYARIDDLHTLGHGRKAGA